MYNRLKAVTLMELLIAIILLSIIVLGIANIDLFSHFHVLSADRRSKLQNEVSLVLEHMTKAISRGIGDANQPPAGITTIAGDDAIRVWVDFNGDSKLDTATDREIAYRFTGASGPPADRYQIWFYAVCVGANCNQAGSIAPEVIAKKISVFNRSVSDNYVNVEVGACWNPASAVSANNPCVNMLSRIKMPSVSTN